MKNIFLLALPLLASAASIPTTDVEAVNAPELETRANCKLTAHYATHWIENGLQRFRVKFWTEGNGIKPESFCQAMNAAHCWAVITNVQCGWDGGFDGGAWRVDTSWTNVPQGYAAYKNCMQETANEWRRVHSGCDVDSRW